MNINLLLNTFALFRKTREKNIHPHSTRTHTKVSVQPITYIHTTDYVYISQIRSTA
jgi:hypothetical protein